jgi:signal transduction histidine kinase
MKEQEAFMEAIHRVFLDEENPISESVQLMREGVILSVRIPEMSVLLEKRDGKLVHAPELVETPHLDIYSEGASNLKILGEVEGSKAFGRSLWGLCEGGGMKVAMTRPLIECVDVGIGLFLQDIGVLNHPDGYLMLISSLKLKDIAFTEILDAEYFQKVVDDLAEITGVRLWVLDMNCMPVAISQFGGEHCKLIVNTFRGVQRCYESAIDSIAELQQDQTPRVRRCHAGFFCFDAPLLLNGEMVGMITGDASLPEQDIELGKYMALATELDLDPEMLLGAISKVRRLKMEEIELYLSIMNVIGQIVTEMSFKHYLLSEKIRELKILNHTSNLLSSGLSGDLDYVYSEVAEQVSSLQEGMSCELELELEGDKRLFKGGSSEDRAPGYLFRVEIKDGGSRQGAIGLRSSDGVDTVSTAHDAVFLESIGSQISMSLQNRNLYQELQRTNEELRRLFRSLTEIQDKERASIAKDLHDNTGQHLTNALLNIDMAFDEPELGAGCRKHLESAASSISSVIQQLHSLSVQLHPPVLDLGLTEAVTNLLRRMNNEYPMEFKIEVEGEEIHLPRDININMYRIVQEALSNIVKHSNAREALVRFKYDKDRIDLVISDNGKGSRGSSDDEDVVQLGIANMRERAAQMGGTFDFSTSTSGTRVIASIPTEEIALHLSGQSSG